MSEIDVVKMKKTIKIVKTINSIKGIPVSENAESFFIKWSEGKFTDEQMHSQMLVMYTNDYNTTPHEYVSDND